MKPTRILATFALLIVPLLAQLSTPPAFLETWTEPGQLAVNTLMESTAPTGQTITFFSLDCGATGVPGIQGSDPPQATKIKIGITHFQTVHVCQYKTAGTYTITFWVTMSLKSTEHKVHDSVTVTTGVTPAKPTPPTVPANVKTVTDPSLKFAPSIDDKTYTVPEH